ncbi:MAG: PBP1A family penicillin-binding protein [Paracoccus sp. (in: a-proteobacteria)]|uniref:transglycosylase domain-containing protein n=1 Tax=Paracoccus sp. TaxID=267 RepID=UPI0026DF5527|nr:PBP1A family penicillin-binding protein [Paracoccus sp. (in: a-proteobacteria)]MDO5622164.1 PBP1A family penicillin-binding protein [Paracoccus sp. (in: a-proteobacteria)]
MSKTTGSKRRVTAENRYARQPATQQVRRAGKPKRGNMVTRGITGIVSLTWRIIWGSFWRLGLTVALILAAATFFYYSQLPSAQALFDARAQGSVTMLDRDGNVFAWRGETFGTVSSDKIAPALKDAVIATEDKRFYNHLGISPRGIASAIRINLEAGRGALEGHGGSTITQQVAKLLCLGQDFDPTQWKNEAEYEADCRKSSLWRKVKEIPFSFALEAKYSKDDILNIYMNRSYLGAGARGFEAASQRYFGKHAAEVTVPEAAMLAGLLKAPSYFAPTANLDRSRGRADVIIGLMQEQGYITPAQADEARKNPAQLSRAAAARAGGYFADWLMDSGPAFLTTETTEDVTITTTFDQRVQRAAERALNRVFQEKVAAGSKAQAAVVVMSADGAVRAMIGGLDNTATGTFNRATQAQRQTGSSFKPFVYAAALDRGYSPNDIIRDAPISIAIPGQKPWTPQNYTRRFYGDVSLANALRQSLNAATVRLQEAVGRDNVIRIAEGFGVSHDLKNWPSLALGVSETSLLNMTGAYAGIRNGGRSVRPYGLVELRIHGDRNPLIGQTGGMGEQVISPQAAAELVGMMKGVIDSGTGTRAKLNGREAAGKTGTTQSSRDAWFIGFTEQYVVGVWMGNDDNTPLKGVTGGGLPAEIWQAVVTEISADLPALPLTVSVPGGEGRYVVGDNGPSVLQTTSDDPLAAALAEAMGQTGGPAEPAAPQAPAAPASPGRPQVQSQPQVDGSDALGDALKGILGGN